MMTKGLIAMVPDDEKSWSLKLTNALNTPSATLLNYCDDDDSDDDSGDIVVI